MNKKTSASLTAWLAGAALGLGSGAASAAGFALIEQSVSGLGNAFAGGAAASEDASAQFFNPAAMMALKGTQATVGAHYVSPTTHIQDEAAAVDTLGGIPVIGGDSGGDAGEDGVVPNLYFVQALGGNAKFGLGINVPFGLATEYNEDWVGRYHAIRSDLATININPAIALRINPKVSIGAGVSAQYAEAELSSAVDSSSICLGLEATAQIPAGTCSAFGLDTPADLTTDSKATVTGDNWSYGYNLGLFFQPASLTEIGLAYRSAITQSLEGNTNFDNSAAFAAFLQAIGSPAFGDTGAKATAELPATLSLSVVHDLDPKLEIMADVTWTQWSVFDELRIKYDNPAQPDSVTTEDWGDSYRYSIGLSFMPGGAFKWRAGLAYDQTPVPNEERRTPRIPDNDRTWLALGFTHTLNKNLWWDLGYAHLFVKDTEINNTTEASIQHTLTGTYESSVDILSAQFNYRF